MNKKKKMKKIQTERQRKERKSIIPQRKIKKKKKRKKQRNRRERQEKKNIQADLMLIPKPKGSMRRIVLKMLNLKRIRRIWVINTQTTIVMTKISQMLRFLNPMSHMSLMLMTTSSQTNQVSKLTMHQKDLTTLKMELSKISNLYLAVKLTV